VRAKEGSPAMHMLLLFRFSRVEGSVRPLWVTGYSTLRRKSREGIRAIPVADPLPYIACHIVETVSVGGKLGHRCNTGKAIFTTIFYREWSLKGVRHPFPVRTQFIAPGIHLAGQPPPSSKLKFSFRRQPLARPLRIRDRIVVGNVDNRIFLVVLEVR